MGVGALLSLIDATPVIETPALDASVSAIDFACAIACWRAWACALAGSSTRNVTPSRVVAPAARPSSMASPILSRSRIVTATPFESV